MKYKDAFGSFDEIIDEDDFLSRDIDECHLLASVIAFANPQGYFLCLNEIMVDDKNNEDEFFIIYQIKLFDKDSMLLIQETRHYINIKDCLFEAWKQANRGSHCYLNKLKNNAEF